MGRSKIARILMDFFVEQGRLLSPKELSAIKDAPVTVIHVRRAWGTYKRCINALKMRYPEEYAKLEEGKPEKAPEATIGGVKVPAPKAKAVQVEKPESPTSDED